MFSRKKPSYSLYLAVINGKEHEFQTKSDMTAYIAHFRQFHNEINKLEMYRVEFFNLIEK